MKALLPRIGKAWLGFGGEFIDGQGRKTQYQFLRVFLYLGIIFSILVSLILREEMLQSSIRVAFLIAILAVNIFSLLALQVKKFKLVLHVLVFSYWILAFSFVIMTGGLESPWIVSQFLVNVLGILLLGGWSGLAIAALNLAGSTAIFFFHSNSLLPKPIMNLGIQENLASIYLNTILITIVVLFSINLLYQSIKRGQVNDSRYRSLFEKTNDAVLLIGMDQRYVNVNQQAADLLGYEIDELIGMTVSDVVVPEERENSQERATRLANEKVLPVYERKVVCKDGSRKTVEVNVALIFDEMGEPVYYQSIVRDVSVRKQVEKELQHSLREMESMAMHDDLTGLLNRRAIMEHAGAEWHRAAREGKPMCVVLIDVDNLKSINDQYGHLEGDQALKSVANSIVNCKRPYDWAGRWGGDEFLLVLPGANLVEASEVANRLQKNIEEMGSKAKRKLHLSSGVACFPGRDEDRLNIETILSQADNALYEAKEKGKNQVAVFRD